MKMLLWWFVVASFLGAVTGDALALSQSAACRPTAALIAHGNGIMTEYDDAIDSMEALSRALQGVLPAEEFQGIRFAVAYNPTNGFIADILESAVQDLSTDVTQFWRFWTKLLPMPENLRRLVEERVAQVDEAALVNTDSLRRHVDLYRANILEGKKVLLVAHSQGTFYANQAFSLLTAAERRSFGIVSVALMDSFVSGPPYPYITLFEDLIVNAVRVVKAAAGQPGPPLSTTTNGGFNEDPQGHHFLKAYMAEASNSRADILTHITGVLRGLEAPPARGEEGIITVTLTWGAQPDVDLHVFEPNGSHVYYGNRVGPSGLLDVDDIDGFGPEHYFVSCAKLETSRDYSVHVNYFRGSAPESAHVLIQAGHLLSREFSVSLSNAVGAAGNETPIPVAHIGVSGNPQQGFQFTIR